MTYSYAQLEVIAKQGGFPDALLPVMAAIAMAESGGNSNAINPSDNGGRQTSWGLWQISDGTHNQPVPNILDPIVNAKAAYQKYQTQGLAAWGTYTSGAYKSYLQSQVPPEALGGASGSGGAAPTSFLDPSTWFNPILSPLADITNYVIWVAITGAGIILIGAGIILLFQTSSGQAVSGAGARYASTLRHVATLPIRYARS